MIAIALSLASALAAPVESPPPSNVRIVARGVIEAWTRDPALDEVFGHGGPFGALGVVVPVAGPAALSIEGSYGRFFAGDDPAGAALVLTPVSLMAEIQLGEPEVQGYVDLGLSFVSFAEEGGASGTRVMGELRGGVRINTGLIVPSMAPAPSPVRALELELSGGRRVRSPGRLNRYGDEPEALTGFNFNAWQLVVGLGVRL